jgi:hypothetical protein
MESRSRRHDRFQEVLGQEEPGHADGGRQNRDRDESDRGVNVGNVGVVGVDIFQPGPFFPDFAGLRFLRRNI